MLYRSLRIAAGAAPRLSALATQRALRQLPLQFKHVRTYADTVIKVPTMAESITEGTLKQWNKQVGDFVEQDEEIATIETDKIDVAVNAPEAGTLKELFVNEEDTVTVGQDLARIELGGAPTKPAESSSSQPQQSSPGTVKESTSTPEPQQPPQESKTAPPPPAPAKEASTPKQAASSSAPSESGVPMPDNRGEKRVKMNRMRLRIAERLKQSQNTAASLTTFQKVDMSALMEFRKKYKDDVLKRTGVKLGFMSAFSKASVLAMRELPVVNAAIDGGEIVYHDYIDISVAVATEKGLVTPVVRNVESMDMVEIEKSIADLGKKARDGKLTIEDMAGGTFTISNGGVFGSLFGTPIINLPQTAVLGLHAINDEVVVRNGQMVIRPIMYLALTYDHRLLDGREAVTFLKMVKEYIEDPRSMLL